MKRIKKDVKISGEKEEKVVTDKPKKEFKIEIVKIGKIEGTTTGCIIVTCYDCSPSN